MYEVLILIFTLALAIHIYTDFKEQLLYDKVTAVLLGAGILYTYCFGNWWEAFLGSLSCVGIMLFIYWVSRGGMGFGDVKLAFVLGVWLGLEQGLLCLLLAFIAGGSIGALLLITGVKSRKDAIPFGPYLCVSAWVSLIWGQKLLLWYWQLWS